MSRPAAGRDFVHRGFGGAAVPGDIAPLVVLVTGRAEADALAATWADARQVADHYAWRAWTGFAHGCRLTVCSTGTGSATAAVGIEELAILGARTFLAVGATRTPLDDPDTILVAEGAARVDAASAGYARPGYPAAADVEVVMAAISAARAAGLHPRMAILADPDAEIEATMGDAPRPAAAAALERLVHADGVVPVRGSPSTLFVQAGVHGLRAGSLAADAAPEHQARLRAVATAALVRLDAWDRGDDGRPTPFAARMAASDPHPQP